MATTDNDVEVGADDLIGMLPRSGRRFPNCVAWVDAAGRLCLDLVAIGPLVFTEHPEYEDQWTLEVGDT